MVSVSVCPSYLQAWFPHFSIVLAGIMAVLRPPFVMTAVPLNKSHPPRRRPEVRNGAQLTETRLVVEPSPSETAHHAAHV